MLDGHAQINTVELGRASNVYTALRTEQNQVYANDASGTVAFIHRQDVTIWGGGSAASGRLRYDISTDGGASFTNDVGVLNAAYTYSARYPQLTGGANGLVWAAPTLVSGGWDGMVAGLSNGTASSGTMTTTENYVLNGENTNLQGGLCPGLPGEYWTTDRAYSGTLAMDSVHIYKGTYNSGTNDVDWALHKGIFLNPYLGFDGVSRFRSPITAFSPDGMDGWVGLVGDMIGGSDTTYNPIFIHSSDGGATWGAPMEVDLRTVNYLSDSTSIMDELKYLWVNASQNPLSSGKPTCTFNFDLAVDAQGNPHMFVVVGSASTINNPAAAYTVYSSLVKLAIDVFSEDGGLTWNAVKVAPIYTFRGEFGTPDATTGLLLEMDNHTQISRTANGSHVFYSWVDSDTTVVGFGESDNLAPNLRIAGRRTADGFMTCPTWITLNDPVWDGRALWPSMAPEVLTDGSTYKLPIVIPNMFTNNQVEPCQFHYFGNDATLNEADFIAHSSLLDSDHCTIISPVSVAATPRSQDMAVYPNPSNDQLHVTGLDPLSDNLLELVNSLGQTVLSQRVKGQATTRVDVAMLPAGLYRLRIGSNSGTQVRAVVVAH